MNWPKINTILTGIAILLLVAALIYSHIMTIKQNDNLNNCQIIEIEEHTALCCDPKFNEDTGFTCDREFRLPNKNCSIEILAANSVSINNITVSWEALYNDCVANNRNNEKAYISINNSLQTQISDCRQLLRLCYTEAEEWKSRYASCS